MDVGVFADAVMSGSEFVFLPNFSIRKIASIFQNTILLLRGGYGNK